MVKAQEAYCQMIGSGLEQLSPADKFNSSTPQTAAECLKVLSETQFLTYGIFIIGAYIFAAVLGGFTYTFWLLFFSKIYSRSRT